MQTSKLLIASEAPDFLTEIPKDEHVGESALQEVEWMQLAKYCFATIEGLIILVVMITQGEYGDIVPMFGTLFWKVVTLLITVLLLEAFYYELYPRCFRKKSKDDDSEKWRTRIFIADLFSFGLLGFLFIRTRYLPWWVPIVNLYPHLPEINVLGVLGFLPWPLPYWSLPDAFGWVLGSLLAFQCRRNDECLYQMTPRGFVLRSADARRDLSAIVYALFSAEGGNLKLGLIQENAEEDTVPDRLLKISDRFGYGFRVLQPRQFLLQSLGNGELEFDANAKGSLEYFEEWFEDSRIDPPFGFCCVDDKVFEIGDGDQDDLSNLNIGLKYESQSGRNAFYSHWVVHMILTGAALFVLVFPLMDAFHVIRDLHAQSCPAGLSPSSEIEICKSAKECQRMCSDWVIFINETFGNLHISWSEFLVPIPLTIVVVLVGALAPTKLDYETYKEAYFGCLPLSKAETSLVKFYDDEVNAQSEWGRILEKLGATLWRGSKTTLTSNDISDNLVFKEKTNGVFSAVMLGVCGSSELTKDSLVFSSAEHKKEGDAADYQLEANEQWKQLKSFLNLDIKNPPAATRAYLDVAIYVDPSKRTSGKDVAKKNAEGSWLDYAAQALGTAAQVDDVGGDNKDWWKSGSTKVNDLLKELEIGFETTLTPKYAIFCHDDVPDPSKDVLPLERKGAPQVAPQCAAEIDWDTVKSKAGRADGVIFRYSFGDIAKLDAKLKQGGQLLEKLVLAAKKVPQVATGEIRADLWISVFTPDPEAYPVLMCSWMTFRRLTAPLFALLISFGVPLWRRCVEHGNMFPDPFHGPLQMSAWLQFFVLYWFFDSFVCSSLMLDIMSQALRILEAKTLAPSSKATPGKAPDSQTPFDMYVQGTEADIDYREEFGKVTERVQWWHEATAHFRAYLGVTRLTSQVTLIAAALILATVLAASIVEAASGGGPFAVNAQALLDQAKHHAEDALNHASKQVGEMVTETANTMKQTAVDYTKSAASNAADATSAMFVGGRRLSMVTAAAALDHAMQPSWDLLHATSFVAQQERRLSKEDKAMDLLDDLQSLDVGKISTLQILTLLVLVAVTWFTIPLILQIATINGAFDRHENLLVAQKAKHATTEKDRQSARKDAEDNKTPEIVTKDEDYKKARLAYEDMLNSAIESSKKNRTRYALTLFGFVINFGLLATWVVFAGGPVLEKVNTLVPQVAHLACAKVEDFVGEQTEGIQNTMESVAGAVNGAVDQAADAVHQGLDQVNSASGAILGDDVVNSKAQGKVDSAFDNLKVHAPNFTQIFHEGVCKPLDKWIKKQAAAALKGLKKQAKMDEEARGELKKKSRRLKAQSATHVQLGETVKQWWATESDLSPDLKLTLLHGKLHALWAHARQVAMLGVAPGKIPDFGDFPAIDGLLTKEL